MMFEGGSYASEMLGNEKKSESLGGFLNAANKVMGMNFGSINIQIGPLTSMRQSILRMSGVRDLYAFRSKMTADQNSVKKVCLKIAHEALHNMNVLTAVTATYDI